MILVKSKRNLVLCKQSLPVNTQAPLLLIKNDALPKILKRNGTSSATEVSLLVFMGVPQIPVKADRSVHVRNLLKVVGPPKLRLEDLEAQLRALIRRTSEQQGRVLRAKIVLCVLFEHRTESETAQEFGVSRNTVRKWVNRFVACPSLDSLDDQERTGRPSHLTYRDVAVIISLACARPQEQGRLESHMTSKVIVEEATKQNVFVSRSTVQRILADMELKPHKERYFLFTPTDRPEYQQRRDEICDLYTRDLTPEEIVICFDEKPGIQALGTRHPGCPAVPGRFAFKEFEYVRHGTRTLAVGMRTDTGEVVAHGVFASFTTQEGISMLRSISLAVPESIQTIHLVWDNGSSHVSKGMQAFLGSSEGQRFQPHYTPVHASWLNQAENFFSRFSRKYLKGRRYESAKDLEEHLNRSIKDSNLDSHPVQWRYNPKAQAA